MNLRRTMYKLQTALCHKGVHVRIDQRQHWSDQSERMVTKYIVKTDNDTILETYQTAEVVKTLAEMYGGG